MSGLFAGTPLEQPVTCPRCNRRLGDCTCPRDDQGKLHDPAQWPARVRREKSRGKYLTIASGLGLREQDQKALLAHLKSKLGVGGSLKDNELTLQGDHRDKLVELLKAQGYPAKPSGG